MKSLYFLILLPHFLFSQTWLQLLDFPGTERDDGVAVTANNTAYFGTGLKTGWTLGNDFYALNLSTNTWSNIASMPAGTERQYASAFKGINSFYVLCGDGISGLTNSVYRYDIALNSWSAMASKPGNPIYGASALEFGDKVIIAGGRTLNNVSNNEVWEYSISNNTWIQKSNFPSVYVSRWRAGTAVLNNIGYILFGLDGNSSYRKELISYDQVIDTWLKIIDFPGIGRTYASLNAFNNHLVLFAGTDTLGTYYQDLWYFDPANLNWTQGPALPSFGRKGGMSCVWNNKLYYSCGINQGNVRLNETWLLDLPLGISDLETNQNSLSNYCIYPNPVVDELYYKPLLYKNINTIRLVLFDMNGKKINTFDGSASGGSIHLSEVPQGLYSLKIYEGNDLKDVRKFIKSN